MIQWGGQACIDGTPALVPSCRGLMTWPTNVTYALSEILAHLLWFKTALYLCTFRLTTTCCCSSRATTTISSRQKPFYLTIIEKCKDSDRVLGVEPAHVLRKLTVGVPVIEQCLLHAPIDPRHTLAVWGQSRRPRPTVMWPGIATPRVVMARRRGQRQTGWA